MALAAVGSKPASRTRRIRSRISPLTSLTPLSAFAVAALDAFLRRLAAFSGAWVQQSPCEPFAGSVQRSPFAFVALHWFICDYLFIEGGGTVWAPGRGGRCRSPSKEAPPTTTHSDGLWVGLQVEEPSAVQHLRTVEMQAPNSVAE